MAEPSQPSGGYSKLSRFDSSGEILNIRSEMMRRRGRMAAAVDWCGKKLAHPPFFIALLVSHVLWIMLNIRAFPFIDPWDPYPFVCLATIASVEAPFISLLILMQQHRSSRIAELREEIDTQVSLHIEREVTLTLRMLNEVHQKLGVESKTDPDTVRQMQEELDPRKLMEKVRQELDEAEGERDEEEM